jgi:hypothetical protein
MPKSIGLLLIGVLIAIAIVLLAPTPLALLLALIALPVEAYLVAAAIHGLTGREVSTRPAHQISRTS